MTSVSTLAPSLTTVWVVSFAIGLPVAFVMRWLSHKIGLVDHPDPTRKLHRGNIALGGGLAVFATTGLAVVAEVVAYSRDASFC